MATLAAFVWFPVVATAIVGALSLVLLLRASWLGRKGARRSSPEPAATADALAGVRDTMAAAGRLLCAHARVQPGVRHSTVVRELGRATAQLLALEQRVARECAAEGPARSARILHAHAPERDALVATCRALAPQLLPLLTRTPALDAELSRARQHAAAQLQKARQTLGADADTAAELEQCEKALASDSAFAAACLALAVVPRDVREPPCTRAAERVRCVRALACAHEAAAKHRADAARLRAAVAVAEARVAQFRADHAALLAARAQHDAQRRALATARTELTAARQRVAELSRTLAQIAAQDAVAAALGKAPTSRPVPASEKRKFLASVQDAVAVQVHHEEELLRRRGATFEPCEEMFLRRTPPRVDAVVTQLARDDTLDATGRAQMTARSTALLRAGCAPSLVPEVLVAESMLRGQQHSQQQGRRRSASLIAFRACGPAASAVPRIVDALVHKATTQCGAPLLALRYTEAVIATRLALRRAHAAVTCDDLTAPELRALVRDVRTHALPLHRAARVPIPAAVHGRPLVCEHVPRLLAPRLWPVPLDRARRFVRSSDTPTPSSTANTALADDARALWAEVLLADDPKAPRRYPHLYPSTTSSIRSSSNSGERTAAAAHPPQQPQTPVPVPPPPPPTLRRPGAALRVSLPPAAVLASAGRSTRERPGAQDALHTWLEHRLQRLGPGRRRQLLLYLRYVARADRAVKRAVLVHVAGTRRRSKRLRTRVVRAVRQLLAARFLLAMRARERRLVPARRAQPFLGPEYRDCGAYLYLPGAWPGADSALAHARSVPRVQHSLVPWRPLFAHRKGSSNSSTGTGTAVPLWEAVRGMSDDEMVALVRHIAAAAHQWRCTAWDRLRETAQALHELSRANACV